MNIGFEAKRIFHNKTGLGNYSRDLVRIMADFFPKNNYLLFNPKKSNEVLFQPNNFNVFEKLPSKKIHQKLKNYWRQKAIISDLKANKIEIFHGLSGEIPSGLRKANIKSVVTIHDLIFLRYPELYSFIDRNIYYFKFKKAAEQADLVIAISEQTKKDIIAFLGISESKIRVVYQGCNDVFKKIYSSEQKEKVKKKYNLPDHFVLNVGTIEARKNALTIVKAVKDIDVDLVLIGRKTKYAEKIDSFIEENQLQNKIHFLHGLSIEELAIVYQLAKVFVYPSIFEGFGIPIIEALYSNIPVITNKDGVFPEAAGENSLFIEPFDAIDLSQKINRLIQNDNYRKDVTKKGFEFVQKFNDEHIAHEMMKVYEELVE